jgi:methylglutaconyl-CoA hydratase
MENISTNIIDGIATITFYHPQSNSMPGEQLRNLAAEIEKIGNDENAKVIVMGKSNTPIIIDGKQ